MTNDLSFDVPSKTYASAVRDALIDFHGCYPETQIEATNPWPDVKLH